MTNSLEDLAKNLSQNVISLRKTRSLTQAKLAELSGATRASIALIESGSANPTMEVLIKISRTLQVSVDELLSLPVADCALIEAADVPVEKKGKRGVEIRKILPDKKGSAGIDELRLEAGAAFAGAPHVEGTREFFTCTEGEFTITVLGRPYVVKEGDVLNFPGDKPHSYRNSARKTSRGFSVILFHH